MVHMEHHIKGNPQLIIKVEQVTEVVVVEANVVVGYAEVVVVIVHWIAASEAVVVVGVATFEAFVVDKVVVVLAEDVVVAFVAQFFSA